MEEPSGQERARLDRLERALEQLRRELGQAHTRGERPLPEPEAPAFGLLVVQTTKERWLLLGERGFAHGPLPVIPWRDSPLARVFMTQLEGEDYELEHGDRLLEGRVVTRWLLSFADGRLQAVHDGIRRLRRDASGRWSAAHAALVDWRPPTAAPPGGTRPHLDRQQRAVIDAPAGGALLVEGAAGSGKTTACLHRLSRLGDGIPEAAPVEAPLLLVPEPGLAELCRRGLAQLATAELEVRTFDAWLQDRGQRCFPELPRRSCQDTPTRVRRFFRHPALLACLPEWAEERVQALVTELDRALFARGALLEAWARLDEPVPAERLNQLERSWKRARTPGQQRRISAAFGRARRDLGDPRPSWEALWQDRRLLERAVALAGGELGEQDIQAVLDHAWLQSSEPSERIWAHVDPARLETLDGRSLDEGTPEEVAGTIDREAWAVLLALHGLLHGPPRSGAGPLPLYAHLMVDEIQERAAVELRVLSAACAPGAGLTMSGDRAQRVNISGSLPAEDELRWSLDRSDLERITLRHAHRSTRAIADFCHRLLGPLAQGGAPRSHHDGPPVLRSVHRGPGEALATMADTLARGFDPRRELAIIAQDAPGARSIHGFLEELCGAALVLDGRFARPSRGVVVTCVDQVGGMEFDAVWVPDADAATYPLRDGARRRLYVACSRARRALWVLSPGQPSRILPD